MRLQFGRKKQTMVRYEVKTPHKSFVGCEPTLKEAKRYIASLVEAGVEILNVEYYDRDERVDAIRNDPFETLVSSARGRLDVLRNSDV
jgi:hypothetical protein